MEESFAVIVKWNSHSDLQKVLYVTYGGFHKQ